jgi:hypothetical protein
VVVDICFDCRSSGCVTDIAIFSFARCTACCDPFCGCRAIVVFVHLGGLSAMAERERKG